MTTPNTTIELKAIIALSYVGGIERVFSTHDSVKEAKEFFKSKVQIGKSHYVAPIGYIKLVKKSSYKSI
jgi:hypothetical protein